MHKRSSRFLKLHRAWPFSIYFIGVRLPPWLISWHKAQIWKTPAERRSFAGVFDSVLNASAAGRGVWPPRGFRHHLKNFVRGSEPINSRYKPEETSRRASLFAGFSSLNMPMLYLFETFSWWWLGSLRKMLHHLGIILPWCQQYSSILLDFCWHQLDFLPIWCSIIAFRFPVIVSIRADFRCFDTASLARTKTGAIKKTYIS